MSWPFVTSGAGALPESSVARTIPPEYLIEPKVINCPRHRSHATGGMGYTKPYSIWTPPGNGCILCEEDKPVNRRKVIHMRLEELQKELEEMKPALASLQEKHGNFKRFTLVEYYEMKNALTKDGTLGDRQVDYELAQLDHKIKTNEMCIDEYERELKECDESEEADRVLMSYLSSVANGGSGSTPVSSGWPMSTP